MLKDDIPLVKQCTVPTVSQTGKFMFLVYINFSSVKTLIINK